MKNVGLYFAFFDSYLVGKEMKLTDLFKKLSITSARISTPIFEVELEFNDFDKKASWNLYVELITRVTTQDIDHAQGDDATALSSVFAVFRSTRQLIKDSGPESIEFAKVAVVVLNYVLRPFLSKWHKVATGVEPLAQQHYLAENHAEFRRDLDEIQSKLRNYTKILAEIIEIPDITDIVSL